MCAGGSISYGKEPFDLRLTVLSMIRNLHIIIGLTVLGTLLFGGGYYVKNVLLNKTVKYTVTSTYKVSYEQTPDEPGDYYMNSMTWSTYVHTKEFLDGVWANLGEETLGDYSEYVSSADELAGMFEAKLDSDILIPSTVVTTDSQKWTLLLAKAVEKTIVEDLVENNEQIAAIKIIDPAQQATEMMPDVRPLRAFVLSGILSLFFVVVVWLLRELEDDSIRLPVTLRRRYGLASVGTVHSPQLKANIDYLFGDRKRIAVCAAGDGIDPAEVVKCLEKDAMQCREWIAVPTPLLCPEACEVMREADGVLLVTEAGSHVGKPMEYVLECLDTQDVKVTAALLWNADEWLIRTYYRLPFAKKATGENV